MYNKYQTGGLQHLTARLIREEVGAELFDQCFKFAVCRDPLKRSISQFKFMTKRKDLRQFIGLPDEFIFPRYLRKIQTRTHVQWMPQSDFLLNDDGTLLVDQLFFLEDLAADVSPLAQAIGLKIETLPVTNTTHHVPDPVVSRKMKQLVYELYQSDYELFADRYNPPV